MSLDRSRLHQGFRTYLENAEKASGKTYDDFAKTLAKSGLAKHGELRAHLMEKASLGHGHANAIVAIWLKYSAAPKTTPAKKAATAPAKKTAVRKSPARKK